MRKKDEDKKKKDAEKKAKEEEKKAVGGVTQNKSDVDLDPTMYT